MRVESVGRSWPRANKNWADGIFREGGHRSSLTSAERFRPFDFFSLNMCVEHHGGLFPTINPVAGDVDERE
jgi:hypothetical protein